MTHFSDDFHLEYCKAYGCNRLMKRSEMVPARRVPRALGQPVNPKARGWYCPEDAAKRGYHPPKQNTTLPLDFTSGT